MTKDNREKIEIVDSLDCNGCQVNHLLEIKEERYHLIIAVGQLAQFRFFKYVSKYEREVKRPPDIGNQTIFGLSVDSIVKQ